MGHVHVCAWKIFACVLSCVHGRWLAHACPLLLLPPTLVCPSAPPPLPPPPLPQTPQEDIVVLTFTSFNLECIVGPSGPYDYVKVYDGATTTSTLLHTFFCATTSQVLQVVCIVLNKL